MCSFAGGTGVASDEVAVATVVVVGRGRGVDGPRLLGTKGMICVSPSNALVVDASGAILMSV